MTKVTGFQQSVRLFQSYDPVTPSILSSFLLHLSDALPSGRVLLRLSVRHGRKAMHRTDEAGTVSYTHLMLFCDHIFLYLTLFLYKNILAVI